MCVFVAVGWGDQDQRAEPRAAHAFEEVGGSSTGLGSGSQPGAKGELDAVPCVMHISLPLARIHVVVII